MKKYTLAYRTGIMIFSIVLALYFVLPNFPQFEKSRFFSLFGKHTVKLGLDLQGGVSVLLEVEVEKAVSSSIVQRVQEMRNLLRDKSIIISRPRVENTGAIQCTLFNASAKESFISNIRSTFPDIILKEEKISGDGIIYTVDYSEEKKQEIASFAVEQAVRTIRNRIDAFGVTEPDIRSQADNRIQVQLPGVRDAKRAVALLGQTARLEFRFVRDDISPQNVAFEPTVELLPYVDTAGTGAEQKIPVSKVVEITGDSIADARPSFDQNGKPDITLVFSADGTVLFAGTTKEGVGRRLAIVLDGIVYSAPVIREAIVGGRASISGNFTVQEAQDLAIILRAGSLPAPVQVLEERTVGPSLGAESIRKGIVATGIAAILVAGFMVLYYGLSGILASCMMLLTLLFLFMELGILGATLTLPGIAGMVLVLGMSVDSNVLIYERIREELRTGINVNDAVHIGFGKAFSAILDSNITTFLTALILYQIGTGPIRGFAITLCMGLIASMYTSLYLSKTCFLLWLTKPRKKISI